MSTRQSTGVGAGASPDPLTFFADVFASYQDAASGAGNVSKYTYHLANNTIKLLFAGEGLIPVITPALEHLRVASAERADLTVYLWDVASTGVSLPYRAWDWQDNISRGDVRSLSNERFQVAYNHFARLLNLLDRERNVALYCTTDAAQLPFSFRGSPLLNILHWWLQPRGLQYVHSGAVGTSAGGIMIVGKGGAGKSTTTLACLQSQLLYAADDYCLVSTSGEPSVYSLYNSAKLATDNLTRLPFLRDLVSNPADLNSSGEKATIFLQQHQPEKLIRCFPLRAVLVPQITGEPQTRMRPISRMNGIRAVAVSTMIQLSGAGKDTFAAVASALKRVPCYELQLGTDMRQLADVLEEFTIRQL